MQMAFAGPDLEADFLKMKGADIDEELGIEQKRNKILNDGTDNRTNYLLIGSTTTVHTSYPTDSDPLFLPDSYSLLLLH